MSTSVDSEKPQVIAVDEVEIVVPVSDKEDKQFLWNEKERRQWMFVLLSGQVFLYMVRALVPVCAVPIGAEFHWEKSTMGAVLGSFFWGYTLTQFIGGYLADQMGGEIIIITAAFFWGLFTIIFPVVPQLTSDPSHKLALVIGVRVLTGLSQGFHNPSVGSLLARRVSRNQRGLIYCVHSAGAHLGVLLVGAIGSVMLGRLGWRMPFLVIGSLSITWGVLTRLTLMYNGRKDENTTDSTSSPAKEPIAWRRLLSSISFWSLLFGHFAHGTAYFIILSWTPTYFHDNFPQAKNWVFNVVPWVVAFPSSLLSGYLSDWLLVQQYEVTLVRKFMESLSLLGTAFFLLMLAFTNNYLVSLFSMAMAVGFGSCHQAGIALNALDIAPNAGGSVFGILNMAGSLPGFVGVYMAGYILEITRSWSAVFLQTAGVCIFGWIFYTCYGTTERLV